MRGDFRATSVDHGPYGNALQAAPPPTDFRFAGMFANADSGLYLTNSRAYDPVAGRWLSRDALGEPSDPAANLYRYVYGNPVSLTDPQGRFGLIGGAIGGLGDLGGQLLGNGGEFRCVDYGEVAASAAFGALLGSGLGEAALLPDLLAAESEGVSTLDQLSAAADRAATTVGPGRGPVYGTAVHSVFQDEVDALGNTNLATEQSYLNGRLVSMDGLSTTERQVPSF